MAENDLSYGACFALAPSQETQLKMMRSAMFYFELCVFLLIAVSYSYDLKTKTRNLQGKQNSYQLLPLQRMSGQLNSVCNQQGSQLHITVHFR